LGGLAHLNVSTPTDVFYPGGISFVEFFLAQGVACQGALLWIAQGGIAPIGDEGETKVAGPAKQEAGGSWREEAQESD
jgi:hypothetical protein